MKLVYDAKVLNDIYKMILKDSVFARVLFSQNFNIEFEFAFIINC